MSRKVHLLVIVILLMWGWNCLAIAQEKIYDPVCGMTTSKETPHTAEHEGRTYYFCSDVCKGQFSKDPVKYACFCLSGSDCLHCAGNVANCPCEKRRHDHGHCHGRHKGD